MRTIHHILIQDLCEIIVYTEETSAHPRFGTWAGWFELESHGRITCDGAWTTVIGMGNISSIKVECTHQHLTPVRRMGIANLIHEAMGIKVGLSRSFDPA